VVKTNVASGFSRTLVEVAREAFFGLYHHRFRAALSMLGIS